jgi:hypothetical protein
MEVSDMDENVTQSAPVQEAQKQSYAGEVIEAAADVAVIAGVTASKSTADVCDVLPDPGDVAVEVIESGDGILSSIVEGVVEFIGGLFE